MPGQTLLRLKPDQLLTHPRNMRRFYPAEQVREMADSIKATGGVLEPLIVTRDPGSGSSLPAGKWLVVDGNMRLAGAKLLDGKCPPLDCKVVESSEAEQLLTMVAANQVRYDVDPVSEALHYKRLQEQGLTIREISKQTGVYEARIYKRLLLAKLDKEVQQLIVDNKFPNDDRAVKALLAIPAERRVKLAQRLAERPGLKIETVVKACHHLVQRALERDRLSKRPAVEHSGAEAGGRARAADLRAAAARTCSSCNQYEGQLARNPEPAWSLVVHAADATCDTCALKDVQTVCASCPAVLLLKKLVAAKPAAAEANGRH